MLLTFTVTNFKSIRDPQTLSMVGTSLRGPHAPREIEYPGGQNGVLPCAIIYGANASGKSNILDAFMHMKFLVQVSHQEKVRNKGISFSPYLLDPAYAEKPTEFEVSFLRDKVRYDYGFSHDAEAVVSEWLYAYPEGRRRKLFERDGKNIDFGSGMRGAKKILATFLTKTSLFLSVASQNSHEELGAVSNFFEDIFSLNRISVASTIINQSFSNGEVDLRAIKFLEAIGSGVCDFRVDANDIPEEQKKVVGEVVKILAAYQGLEPSQELPEIDDKEYEVRLGHRSKDGASIYFAGKQESAGTRRLLLMMNYIFKVLDEGDIAVIDEIDASLHTFAVEAILMLFVDPRINMKGAQLIATTHDTNLLNTSNLRRDEIWFAEKNITGESEYFALSEIKARREEAIEKSYLQGRYGATPPKLPAEVFITSSSGEME
ncbi:AAA family ATPase [Celeribacter sp.]|uniref:AAA family ATPase n=1 Tax=Celeribacter sp. TaxID=1890673 RepID=UPI003A920996